MGLIVINIMPQNLRVSQNLMEYVYPWFTYTSASKSHAPQNLIQQGSKCEYRLKTYSESKFPINNINMCIYYCRQEN